MNDNTKKIIESINDTQEYISNFRINIDLINCILESFKATMKEAQNSSLRQTTKESVPSLENVNRCKGCGDPILYGTHHTHCK